MSHPISSRRAGRSASLPPTGFIPPGALAGRLFTRRRSPAAATRIEKATMRYPSAIITALFLCGTLQTAHAQCIVGEDGDRTRDLLADGTITHVRVIFGEKPDDKAVVAWSSAEWDEETTAQVRYGLATTPCPDDDSTCIVDASSGQYAGDSGDFYHHALLDDLHPDRRYYFQVGADGVWSDRIHSFQTAPRRSTDASFKLLVGGDSRMRNTADDEDSCAPAGESEFKIANPEPGEGEAVWLRGRECRQEMNGLMADLFARNDDIVALWHGGDYISDGREWLQWCLWLDDHAATTVDGRLLPIIPTRGNHEKDRELYGQVFGYPGMEDLQSSPRDIHVTTVGRVEMYTLDSEMGKDEIQELWDIDEDDWKWSNAKAFVGEKLREELQSSDSAVTWRMASYHHPAFPAAKSRNSDGKDILKEWVPIFEDFGFDLVFESDGHAYKRTEPRFRDSEQPHAEGGVVYMGEGGLGAPLRTPKSDLGYIEEDGKFRHVMLVSVKPDALKVKVYAPDDSDDGRMIADRLTLSPRTHVPFGSLWRSYDGGDPGAFADPAFDDSDWREDNATFGDGKDAFDDDGDNADIGDDEPTVYFRKTLYLDRAPAQAEMNVWFEDGVAVYVNGIRVYDHRMGAHDDHDDYASSSSDGGSLRVVDEIEGSGGAALADAFVVGANVIAVEVKRYEADMDVSFDLSLLLSGEQ